MTAAAAGAAGGAAAAAPRAATEGGGAWRLCRRRALVRPLRGRAHGRGRTAPSSSCCGTHSPRRVCVRPPRPGARAWCWARAVAVLSVAPLLSARSAPTQHTQAPAPNARPVRARVVPGQHPARTRSGPAAWEGDGRSGRRHTDSAHFAVAALQPAG